MQLQPATIKCNACGKEFESQIIVECSVKTFSTALKEELEHNQSYRKEVTHEQHRAGKEKIPSP